MALRIYYAITGTGFFLSSFAATQGVGPRWPNYVIFAVVAAMAGMAQWVYAIRRASRWRRLAVSAATVALSARIIGWMFSDVPYETKVAAAGASLIPLGLIYATNDKARRLTA